MKPKKNAKDTLRDESVPMEQRIADLLGKMTLGEKISQLTDNAPAIERLGLPKFVWGGECLHGLCNRGRATQFPMPIGMAASFDPVLLEEVASAVSDEIRARHHDPAWRHPDQSDLIWDKQGMPSRKANLTAKRPDLPRVGLAFYTPVINILRDPRWGRAQETYGEDPYLTGVMGAAFVRGLQGKHPKYLKVAACAKHLAVHSGPETLRRKFNAIVSRKDLAETYLPAFEALTRAGAATVMTTYNRVNGEHCCASPTLIGEFLRGRFGFDGMVLSDGGALGSLHTSHQITKDAVETAGVCLKNGCDLELGLSAYPYAAQAIKRGLISESDVDRAVARILKVRFQVGEFDPPAKIPYTRIPRSVVQSPGHLRLARQMADKSLVLLKNNGILPFGPDRRVVLCTGPNAADQQVLLGNFYRGISAKMHTIVEGVVAAAPEGVVVTHMQGCFLTHPNVFPSTWTFGLSEWADAVVMVIGYSPLMEGEQGECIGAPDGGDKSDIGLPPNQLQFLREMKKKGKPIVAVVTGGSAMDLCEVHKLADAVLLAWYPGEQGGLAVGDAIFGMTSPSGKLPVTFPKSTSQLPAYTDYRLKGRTYRYMTKEPMYPFGFGLSYTRFSYGRLKLSAKRIKCGASLRAEVVVTNTGTIAAEEVVQLYLKDNEASVAVPHCALKGFQRIGLAPGKSKRVEFTITPAMMKMVNNEGNAVLEPGAFTVTIGSSSPGSRSQVLGAPKPAVGQFVVA